MFTITRVLTRTCRNISKHKPVHFGYVMPKISRSMHVSSVMCHKMYVETENKYAYDIMQRNGYAVQLDKVLEHSNQNIDYEMEKRLQENWCKKSPSELLEMFREVTFYCYNENVCISNGMFDHFIDSFTDNIVHLTDDEMREVFYLMNKLPEPNSVKMRNFIEIWAALDDACFIKMKKNNWSFDTMLEFVSLMYMLNLTRISDYTFKSLQKLTNKAKQLSTQQIVQLLFFIGLMRKTTLDFHTLEIMIENKIDEFSIDELAIISMGFFKSQTPIRSMPLVTAIVNKVIENSKSIQEISLAALLKIIRYSMKITFDDCIYRLFDALKSEVPRLSVMCCVHFALLGTATLTFHRDCLNVVATTVLNNLTKARVKDLERLTFTFGTFNLIPNTNEPFFESILNELRKAERDAEISKYPRSFANCLAFMSFVDLHPQDLINKVLDKDFLTNAYGKSVYVYGREILALHNFTDIYFKDVDMNRLNDKTIGLLAKKYTDYVPNENYKKQYNVAERLILDVMNTLSISRGPDYVKGYHILPHYQRGDIVLCVDKNGNHVKVNEFGPEEKFGPVTFPPDDNIWIVLIIAGRNGIIKDSEMCTGPFVAKMRELKAIGYHPAMVKWSTWITLNSYEEKLEYLNKLVNEAINDK